MNDTITATTTMQLRPFEVPKVALRVLPPGRRQDGIKFGAADVPLTELDRATLDALAQRWITELYQRAGHHDAPVLSQANQES